MEASWLSSEISDGEILIPGYQLCFDRHCHGGGVLMYVFDEFLVSVLPPPSPPLHLQYLIAYSMQIQRGKAWEIWLLAVMSGGQCPTRNLKALSCTIGLRAGGQSVSQYHPSFIAPGTI